MIKMKKLVFKKWVNWLFVGVAIISAITMCGDCEDLSVLFVSKAIAGIVFYISCKLLMKHGRREVL